MVETLKVTSAKGEEKRLFNAKEESIKNPERKSSEETQTIQREPISIGKKTYTEGSSSEQERKVNALASGADEGRDKLR